MIKKKYIAFIFTMFSIACLHAQKVGSATFYHNRFHGHHTSDGGTYNPDSMTCAHRSYPLGTLLRVKNPQNGKYVVVKVTDRGPYSRRLMIDLSYRAAKELDIIRKGIAAVEITEFKLSNLLSFEPLEQEIKSYLQTVFIKNDPIFYLEKNK